MSHSRLFQFSFLTVIPMVLFWMSTAMASERTIWLSTGPVNLLDHGEGPTLVLLHANPGNLRDFDAIIPTLSESYRVIAIDWPGYGVSPGLGPLTTTTETALYAVLVEAMDTLEIPEAVIIGNSVGGQIAARYAIEFPDRVSGLVLVSPGGFTPDTWLTRFFMRWQSSSWSLAPGFFAKLYIGRRNAHTQSIFNRAASLHSTTDVLKVTREMWGSFLDPSHDLSQSARTITQPSLLVFGKRDPVIQFKKDGQVAKAAMEHAELVALDCGHMAFAELPDEFLGLLLAFLQRNNIQ